MHAEVCTTYILQIQYCFYKYLNTAASENLAASLDDVHSRNLVDHLFIRYTIIGIDQKASGCLRPA